jgi:hypothetical protein
MTTMKQDILRHIHDAEQAINSVAVEDCIWRRRKLRTEFMAVSDALHKLAQSVERKMRDPKKKS